MADRNDGEDFLTGDDLDCFFDIYERDLIDSEKGFETIIDGVFEESTGCVESFVCDVCDKSFGSQRGQRRHMTMKHKQLITKDVDDSAGQSLKIDTALKQSVDNLKNDLCHSEAFRERLKHFEWSVDEVACLSTKFSDAFACCHDPQKYYASFFSVLSCNKMELQNLSVQEAMALLTEFGNCFLAISEQESSASAICTASASLSSREISAMQYLAGYCCQKAYAKIRKRCHKSAEEDQCLEFLRENKTTDAQTLVDCRDRGGLWKVSSCLLEIFQAAEIKFIAATAHHITNINVKNLVSAVLESVQVQDRLDSLFEEFVVSDGLMDTIEQLLETYLSVRSHSYGKQMKESLQAGKKRSLRTELKRKSTDP